jgi:hypothetical protein
MRRRSSTWNIGPCDAWARDARTSSLCTQMLSNLSRAYLEMAYEQAEKCEIREIPSSLKFPSSSSSLRHRTRVMHTRNNPKRQSHGLMRVIKKLSNTEEPLALTFLPSFRSLSFIISP